MVRHVFFVGCLVLFSAAAMFVGVAILQRLAIAAGSYNPVMDDAYSGTVEEYCSGLLRNAVAACAIAVASGIATVLTRPQRFSMPR